MDYKQEELTKEKIKEYMSSAKRKMEVALFFIDDYDAWNIAILKPSDIGLHEFARTISEYKHQTNMKKQQITFKLFKYAYPLIRGMINDTSSPQRIREFLQSRQINSVYDLNNNCQLSFIVGILSSMFPNYDKIQYASIKLKQGQHP